MPLALILVLAALPAQEERNERLSPWIGRVQEAVLGKLPPHQELKLAHGSVLFGTLSDAEGWSAFFKASDGTEAGTRKKLPEKPEIDWKEQAVVFIVFKGYGYDPHLGEWKPPLEGKAELRIQPLLVSAGVPGIPGPRAILYRVDKKDLRKLSIKWDLKKPPAVGEKEAVESDALGEIEFQR